MKNRIQKLNNALQVVEPCEIKQPVLLVYLAIVVLGLRIPEVANHFKLPEKKVETAVSVVHYKFKKNILFRKKMITAARIYNVDNNVLKLVS